MILAKEFTLEPCTTDITFIWSGGKSRWENAAKTIVKIGWPKVDDIIIPMFIWLLDPNWPGTSLIYDFLLTLPKEVLHTKIMEVADNPQNYIKRDYEDLQDQFEDLCEDAGIQFKSK